MQGIYTLKSVINPDGRPKVNPVTNKYIGKKCHIERLVPGWRATLSFRHWENGNIEPYLMTSKVISTVVKGHNIVFETKNSIYTLIGG